MRFEGLSHKTRSDVEAAAERGELHTDPAIAASSIEWAHRRLARRKMAGELALLAIGAAINAIALANLPEGDGLRDFWREQRLCKRITKIAARTGFEAPPWALVPATTEARVPVGDLVARSGLGIEPRPARKRPRQGTPKLPWPR